MLSLHGSVFGFTVVIIVPKSQYQKLSVILVYFGGLYFPFWEVISRMGELKIDKGLTQQS
jgi:hypothetical protein